MNARARILRFLLPLLLLFGSPGAARPVQPPAHQGGLTWLEQLILADSFVEAGKLAAEALADPAADHRTLAACGLALLKTGRIAEAEALFNKVIGLEPDHPEAHLGLGRIDRIRNDPEAAICHLRRAVRSDVFYGEAFHQLWRAAWDHGRVCDLFDIYERAEECYRRRSRPLPSWFTNGLAQIGRIPGERLFKMEGRFAHMAVPLIENTDPRVRIRMIALRLNGQGEYLFDIDSASADFLTISPLLAEELGLVPTGRSTATGVGTGEAAVRFAMLDKVELGEIAFRNVPVMVSDLHPFRGLKKGLLGTALLKRFNVTIDVDAKRMDLYPVERPDLLAAAIDRKAVAADVPLYLFDATVVEAAVGGAPAALYILDSAAATNLVDGDFFAEHLKPKLDPARIVRSGIRGAQGAQSVNRVEGLPVALGPLTFDGQAVHEFPMGELNAIGRRYLAGLLGNPLLWPYRVHMDFRGGRLILEKRPGS
jgi:tetratricopeptide (TPR) repeat protein